MAVEPEIDASLIRMLAGDAGLDVDSTEEGVDIEPRLGGPLPLEYVSEGAVPEPVAPPDAAAEVDIYGLDDTYGFEDEGMPQQGQLPTEDFIPALLTIERRRQYPTACQYWVKLENRLPFKIRNMALRFTTYLQNDSYDRPVIFDSEVRSFSELRPTDTQYRNIFYEQVDCADLNYIKVEDAGRCSMGALTKFSAQKGDCARFVEVQPSELICIFLDDGTFGNESGGGSERNPCSVVAQQDVDRLLTRLIQYYDERNTAKFSALFSPQVVSNESQGLEGLRRAFPSLFHPAEGSSLKLGNVSWKPRGGGAAGIWLSFRVAGRAGGEPIHKTFRVAMRAHLHKGQLVISHFLHEKRK